MKLHHFRNSSFILSVALLTMKVMAITQASVSGKGALAASMEGIEQTVQAVPFLERIGVELALGLLLLLLGFFLHAWIITHASDEERPVRVIGVPGAKSVKRIPDPKWFWVEMAFDKE